jgi:hypothetical protein
LYESDCSAIRTHIEKLSKRSIFVSLYVLFVCWIQKASCVYLNAEQLFSRSFNIFVVSLVVLAVAAVQANGDAKRVEKKSRALWMICLADCV